MDVIVDLDVGYAPNLLEHTGDASNKPSTNFMF